MVAHKRAEFDIIIAVCFLKIFLYVDGLWITIPNIFPLYMDVFEYIILTNIFSICRMFFWITITNIVFYT